MDANADVKIGELAELLDQLTFLNGPHGKMSDWHDLEVSLGEALKRYSLELFYHGPEKEYMVRSIFGKEVMLPKTIE